MKDMTIVSWTKWSSFSAIAVVLTYRWYPPRELVVLGLLLAVMFLVIVVAIGAMLFLLEGARAAGRWAESRISLGWSRGWRKRGRNAPCAATIRCGETKHR